MNTRLKDLTEKLYQEGVSKGQVKAQQQIDAAQQEAEDILKQAQEQAQKIVQDAEIKAKNLLTNAEAERQLKFDQAKSALKQEIEHFISGSIVKDTVQPAMADVQFMQQLITEVTTAWVKDNNVTLFVNEEQKNRLSQQLAGQAKEMLDKGVEIQTVNGIKAGFKIGPADGSYVVSFTENDFINYLAGFLRPQMMELLFHPQSK